MTDNPRLRQVLDELHDSHATPEEVCSSCPELLPEVRARWQAGPAPPRRPVCAPVPRESEHVFGDHRQFRSRSDRARA